MSYQAALLPLASSPDRHGFARLRGRHGVCAALALVAGLLLASSLAQASRNSAAGVPAKERLAAYVPWIEKTLRLPQGGAGGASTKEFARYYAWSKGYPGDVRVVLLRDPAHAGVHIVEVDDIPASADGACDMAARVDVVKRRIMEVGCNPAAG